MPIRNRVPDCLRVLSQSETEFTLRSPALKSLIMTGQVTLHGSLHRQRIEVLQCIVQIRVSDLQCNCALECSVICHLKFFYLNISSKAPSCSGRDRISSAFLIIENLDLVALHHFDPLVVMQCSKCYI